MAKTKFVVGQKVRVSKPFKRADFQCDGIPPRWGSAHIVRQVSKCECCNEEVLLLEGIELAWEDASGGGEYGFKAYHFIAAHDA